MEPGRGWGLAVPRLRSMRFRGRYLVSKGLYMYAKELCLTNPRRTKVTLLVPQILLAEIVSVARDICCCYPSHMLCSRLPGSRGTRLSKGALPFQVQPGQSPCTYLLCIGYLIAIMFRHPRVPRKAFYVAKSTRVDRGNPDCLPTQSHLSPLLPACQDAIQLSSPKFPAS